MRRFLLVAVGALALLLPADLAAATRVYVVSRPVVRVNSFGPGYAYGYRVLRPRPVFLRDGYRCHRRHRRYHRRFYRQRFGPVIVVPRLY
ncbi:MAG TPA: hypothetical protein VNK82_13725 [Terriglobales bacterium]|nr:hypothetical protein [Terriglobales bacterium]